MLLKIFPTNINQRYIDKAVEYLNADEVIIIPTDTVYAFAASLNSNTAIEKLCKLKGLDPQRAYLSVMFTDLSNLSEFTTQVNNPVFRLLKKYLPGPFTFILEANSNVPKLFRAKRKTIGIRIPDNEIVHQLLKTLGTPIVVSSLHDDDDIVDYTTDPEQINEHYQDKVALIIDGGYGNNIPSTIVDCSKGDIEIIRQGAGELEI
jgi:tRNA threonylcarbamoyl adenosine modification protein (Sua5/YciO/YrdC/YwlC family)